MEIVSFRQKHSLLLKTVALFLSISLSLLESLSYASSVYSSSGMGGAGQTPRELNLSRVSAPQSSSLPLTLPDELGHIEEFHQGTSGKTMVYIQDAHDSLEAQENIAKMVSLFVEKYGVKTVFEEGYEGPVPTEEYFGSIQDPVLKEKISYFLMDQLRLGGAEYAHINRPHPNPLPEGEGRVRGDFELIGADSLQGHLDNIRAYRQAARHQRQVEKDLNAIQKEMKTLGAERFSPRMKEWMKLKERLDEGKIGFVDYAERLFRQQIVGANPRVRPTFNGPIQDRGPTRGSAPTTSYPNLFSLIAAKQSNDPGLTERVKSINPRHLFEEILQAEDDLAKSELKTPRDLQIFDYYRQLELLKRLNRMEISSAEYDAVVGARRVATDPPATQWRAVPLQTEELADFLVKEGRRSIALSKDWERFIQNAIRFYEIAKERDRAIERALVLERQHNVGADPRAGPQFQGRAQGPAPTNVSILVFGGFHKDAIKEILKRRGFSYYIITPRITEASKRHQDYYKRLMVGEHHPFEVSLGLVSRAAAVERAFEVYSRSKIQHLIEIASQSKTFNPALLARELTKHRSEMRLGNDQTLRLVIGAYQEAVQSYAKVKKPISAEVGEAESKLERQAWQRVVDSRRAILIAHIDAGITNLPRIRRRVHTILLSLFQDDRSSYYAFELNQWIKVIAEEFGKRDLLAQEGNDYLEVVFQNRLRAGEVEQGNNEISQDPLRRFSRRKAKQKQKGDSPLQGDSPLGEGRVNDSSAGRSEVRKEKLTSGFEAGDAALKSEKIVFGGEGGKSQFEKLDVILNRFKPFINIFQFDFDPSKPISNIVKSFAENAELAAQVFEDGREFAVAGMFGSPSRRLVHGRVSTVVKRLPSSRMSAFNSFLVAAKSVLIPATSPLSPATSPLSPATSPLSPVTSLFNFETAFSTWDVLSFRILKLSSSISKRRELPWTSTSTRSSLLSSPLWPSATALIWVLMDSSMVPTSLAVNPESVFWVSFFFITTLLDLSRGPKLQGARSIRLYPRRVKSLPAARSPFPITRSFRSEARRTGDWPDRVPVLRPKTQGEASRVAESAFRVPVPQTNLRGEVPPTRAELRTPRDVGRAGRRSEVRTVSASETSKAFDMLAEAERMVRRVTREISHQTGLPTIENMKKLARMENVDVMISSDLSEINKAIPVLKMFFLNPLIAVMTAAGVFISQPMLQNEARKKGFSIAQLKQFIGMDPKHSSLIWLNEFLFRERLDHAYLLRQFFLAEVLHGMERKVVSDLRWQALPERESIREAVNALFQMLFYHEDELQDFSSSHTSWSWSLAEKRALYHHYRKGLNPNQHAAKILQRLKRDVETNRSLSITEGAEKRQVKITALLLKSQIPAQIKALQIYLSILSAKERFSRYQTLFPPVLKSPTRRSEMRQTALYDGEAKELAALVSRFKAEAALAALNIAQQIHERKIEMIFLSGGSAPRTLKIFEEAWKKLYKREPLPVIHLFDSDDNKILQSKPQQGSTISASIDLLSFQKILTKRFGNWDELKTKKIVYLDDYIQTATKYQRLKKSFQASGFQSVFFAFFAVDKDRFQNWYLGQGGVYHQDMILGPADPNIFYIFYSFAFEESVVQKEGKQYHSISQEAFQQLLEAIGRSEVRRKGENSGQPLMLEVYRNRAVDMLARSFGKQTLYKTFANQDVGMLGLLFRYFGNLILFAHDDDFVWHQLSTHLSTQRSPQVLPEAAWKEFHQLALQIGSRMETPGTPEHELAMIIARYGAWATFEGQTKSHWSGNLIPEYEQNAGSYLDLATGLGGVDFLFQHDGRRPLIFTDISFFVEAYLKESALIHKSQNVEVRRKDIHDLFKTDEVYGTIRLKNIFAYANDLTRDTHFWDRMAAHLLPGSRILIEDYDMPESAKFFESVDQFLIQPRIKRGWTLDKKTSIPDYHTTHHEARKITRYVLTKPPAEVPPTRAELRTPRDVGRAGRRSEVRSDFGERAKNFARSLLDFLTGTHRDGRSLAEPPTEVKPAEVKPISNDQGAPYQGVPFSPRLAGSPDQDWIDWALSPVAGSAEILIKDLRRSEVVYPFGVEIGGTALEAEIPLGRKMMSVPRVNTSVLTRKAFNEHFTQAVEPFRFQEDERQKLAEEVFSLYKSWHLKTRKPLLDFYTELRFVFEAALKTTSPQESLKELLNWLAIRTPASFARLDEEYVISKEPLIPAAEVKGKLKELVYAVREENGYILRENYASTRKKVLRLRAALSGVTDPDQHYIFSQVLNTFYEVLAKAAPEVSRTRVSFIPMLNAIELTNVERTELLSKDPENGLGITLQIQFGKGKFPWSASFSGISPEDFKDSFAVFLKKLEQTKLPFIKTLLKKRPNSDEDKDTGLVVQFYPLREEGVPIMEEKSLGREEIASSFREGGSHKASGQASVEAAARAFRDLLLRIIPLLWTLPPILLKDVAVRRPRTYQIPYVKFHEIYKIAFINADLKALEEVFRDERDARSEVRGGADESKTQNIQKPTAEEIDQLVAQMENDRPEIEAQSKDLIGIAQELKQISRYRSLFISLLLAVSLGTPFLIGMFMDAAPIAVLPFILTVDLIVIKFIFKGPLAHEIQLEKRREIVLETQKSLTEFYNVAFKKLMSWFELDVEDKATNFSTTRAVFRNIFNDATNPELEEFKPVKNKFLNNLFEFKRKYEEFLLKRTHFPKEHWPLLDRLNLEQRLLWINAAKFMASGRKDQNHLWAMKADMLAIESVMVQIDNRMSDSPPSSWGGWGFRSEVRVDAGSAFTAAVPQSELRGEVHSASVKLSTTSASRDARSEVRAEKVASRQSIVDSKNRFFLNPNDYFLTTNFRSEVPPTRAELRTPRDVGRAGRRSEVRGGEKKAESEREHFKRLLIHHWEKLVPVAAALGVVPATVRNRIKHFRLKTFAKELRKKRPPFRKYQGSRSEFQKILTKHEAHLSDVARELVLNYTTIKALIRDFKLEGLEKKLRRERSISYFGPRTKAPGIFGDADFMKFLRAHQKQSGFRLLTDQEWKILDERFGVSKIRQGDPFTRARDVSWRVGQKRGITGSRIRQVEEEAFQKLQSFYPLGLWKETKAPSEALLDTETDFRFLYPDKTSAMLRAIRSLKITTLRQLLTTADADWLGRRGIGREKLKQLDDFLTAFHMKREEQNIRQMVREAHPLLDHGRQNAFVQYALKLLKHGGDYARFIRNSKIDWFDLESYLDFTPQQKKVMASSEPLEFLPGLLYQSLDDLLGSMEGKNFKGESGWTRVPAEHASIGFVHDSGLPAILVIDTKVFNDYLRAGQAELKMFKGEDVDPYSMIQVPLPLGKIKEVWISEDSRHVLKSKAAVESGRAALFEEWMAQKKIKIIPGLKIRKRTRTEEEVMDSIQRYIFQRDLLKTIPAFKIRTRAEVHSASVKLSTTSASRDARSEVRAEKVASRQSIVDSKNRIFLNPNDYFLTTNFRSEVRKSSAIRDKERFRKLLIQHKAYRPSMARELGVSTATISSLITDFKLEDLAKKLRSEKPFPYLRFRGVKEVKLKQIDDFLKAFHMTREKGRSPQILRSEARNQITDGRLRIAEKKETIVSDTNFLPSEIRNLKSGSRSEVRNYSGIRMWPEGRRMISPLNSFAGSVRSNSEKALMIGSTWGGWIWILTMSNFEGGNRKRLAKSLSRVTNILFSSLAFFATSRSVEPALVLSQSKFFSRRNRSNLSGTSSSRINFIPRTKRPSRRGKIPDSWRIRPRIEGLPEYGLGSSRDNSLGPLSVGQLHHFREVQGQGRRGSLSGESMVSHAESEGPPQYISQRESPLKGVPFDIPKLNIGRLDGQAAPWLTLPSSHYTYLLSARLQSDSRSEMRVQLQDAFAEDSKTKDGIFVLSHLMFIWGKKDVEVVLHRSVLENTDLSPGSAVLDYTVNVFRDNGINGIIATRSMKVRVKKNKQNQATLDPSYPLELGAIPGGLDELLKARLAKLSTWNVPGFDLSRAETPPARAELRSKSHDFDTSLGTGGSELRTHPVSPLSARSETRKTETQSLFRFVASVLVSMSIVGVAVWASLTFLHFQGPWYFVLYMFVSRVIGHFAGGFIDGDLTWARMKQGAYASLPTAFITVGYVYPLKSFALNSPAWTHYWAATWLDLFGACLFNLIPSFVIMGMRSIKPGEGETNLHYLGRVAKIKTRQIFERGGFYRMLVLYWTPITAISYYLTASANSMQPLIITTMMIFSVIGALFALKNPLQSDKRMDQVLSVLNRAYLLPVGGVFLWFMAALTTGNWSLIRDPFALVLTTLGSYWIVRFIVEPFFEKKVFSRPGWSLQELESPSDSTKTASPVRRAKKGSLDLRHLWTGHLRRHETSVSPQDRALFAQFWREIFSSLKPNEKILDAASGNVFVGKVALGIRPDLQVWAVDYADVDRSKLPSAVHFVQSDLENLPNEDVLPHDFDLIVSQYGVEHSDWEKALPQFAARLKSGGRMILLMKHDHSGHLHHAKAQLEQFDFIHQTKLLEHAQAFFNNPPSLKDFETDPRAAALVTSFLKVGEHHNAQHALGVSEPYLLTLFDVINLVQEATRNYEEGEWNEAKRNTFLSELEYLRQIEVLLKERLRAALNEEDLKTFLEIAKTAGLKQAGSDILNRGVEIAGWVVTLEKPRRSEMRVDAGSAFTAAVPWPRRDFNSHGTPFGRDVLRFEARGEVRMDQPGYYRWRIGEDDLKTAPPVFQNAYREIRHRLTEEWGKLYPQDQAWEQAEEWLLAKKQLLEDHFQDVRIMSSSETDQRLAEIERLIPDEITFLRSFNSFNEWFLKPTEEKIESQTESKILEKLHSDIRESTDGRAGFAVTSREGQDVFESLPSRQEKVVEVEGTWDYSDPNNPTFSPGLELGGGGHRHKSRGMGPEWQVTHGKEKLAQGTNVLLGTLEKPASDSEGFIKIELNRSKVRHPIGEEDRRKIYYEILKTLDYLLKLGVHPNKKIILSEDLEILLPQRIAVHFPGSFIQFSERLLTPLGKDKSFLAVYRVMKNANPDFNVETLHLVFKTFSEKPFSDTAQKTGKGKFFIGPVFGGSYVISDEYFEPYTERIDQDPILDDLRRFKIEGAYIEENKRAIDYVGRHFWEIHGERYLVIPEEFEPFVELYFKAGRESMLAILETNIKSLSGAADSEAIDAKSIKIRLESMGVRGADVDDRLTSLLRAVLKINPRVSYELLNQKYQPIRDRFDRHPRYSEDGLHRILTFESVGQRIDNDDDMGIFWKKSGTSGVVYDHPFLFYLRDKLGVPGAFLNGKVDIWESVQHWAEAEYRNDLYVPREHELLVEFYLLASTDDRRILFSEKFDIGDEVKMGVRPLGKGTYTPELGNKEAGFLIFDRLGLPYPPGIALSEHLAKLILERPVGEAGAFIPLIETELRQAGVRGDRSSVRSNPKKSMPGIMRTITNTHNLLPAIRNVAQAWYSERAKAYRKREGLSEAYDMPIIIQEWVDSRAHQLDAAGSSWIVDAAYAKKRSTDPSLPFYGAGVFSTRNPNNNEDVLFGQYLESATGEELMTGGKAGEDIHRLAQSAPEIYQELLEAKKKLEDAVGPREVEFVVRDGKLFFLQNRRINFSPNGEIAYLKEQMAQGKLTEARAIPMIEKLQARVQTRKIYRIRDGVILPRLLGKSRASTPGAFQGFLASSAEAAEKLMQEKKPIIFVSNEDNRDEILPLIFSYPHSALITTYGNDSSHEAVLTRLSGIPSLIHLEPLSLNLKERDFVLLDGDSKALYNPGGNILEESTVVVDASYGIDIPAYRAQFLEPYLHPDGSIKPEFTAARLEALNQEADTHYQRLKDQPDKKAAFTANLEKHFLHELWLQQQQTENANHRSEVRLEGVREDMPVWYFLQAFGIDPAQARVEPIEGSWGRVRLAQHPVLGLEGEALRWAVFENLKDVANKMKRGSEPAALKDLDEAYFLTEGGRPVKLVWSKLAGERREEFGYPLEEFVKEAEHGFYFPTVYPPGEISSLKTAGAIRSWVREHSIDLSQLTAADIGSGAGGLTKLLLELGAKEVHAVDISLLKLMNTQAQVAKWAYGQGRPERLKDLKLHLNEIPAADLYVFNAPSFSHYFDLMGKSGPPSAEGANMVLPSSAAWKILNETAQKAKPNAVFLIRINVPKFAEQEFENLLTQAGWDIEEERQLERRPESNDFERQEWLLKLIASSLPKEKIFLLRAKPRSEVRKIQSVVDSRQSTANLAPPALLTVDRGRNAENSSLRSEVRGGEKKAESEREHFKRVLIEHGAKLAPMAAVLGVTAVTVGNRIKRFRLKTLAKKLRKERPPLRKYQGSGPEFKKILIQHVAHLSAIGRELGLNGSTIRTLIQDFELEGLAKKLRLKRFISHRNQWKKTPRFLRDPDFVKFLRAHQKRSGFRLLNDQEWEVLDERFEVSKTKAGGNLARARDSSPHVGQKRRITGTRIRQIEAEAFQKLQSFYRFGLWKETKEPSDSLLDAKTNFRFLYPNKTSFMFRAFRSLGVTTLRQLLQTSDADWLQYRGIGREKLKQLDDFLKAFHLTREKGRSPQTPRSEARGEAFDKNRSGRGSRPEETRRSEVRENQGRKDLYPGRDALRDSIRRHKGNEYEMADDFGVNQGTVSRWLGKASLRESAQRLRAKRADQAGVHTPNLASERLEKLFQEKKSAKEIARSLGFDVSSVYRLLRQRRQVEQNKKPSVEGPVNLSLQSTQPIQNRTRPWTIDYGLSTANTPGAIYVDAKTLRVEARRLEEVFALASQIQGSPFKLVIYHAAELSAEIYRGLADLGVRLVTGDIDDAFERFGQNISGKQIQMVASADFRSVSKLEAFSWQASELDIWAALLYAISDQAVFGIQKVRGVYRVIDELLRTQLEQFRASLVVRMSA